MSERVLEILAQRRRLLLSRLGPVPPAGDGQRGDEADQVQLARLRAEVIATRGRQFEQLRAIAMAEQRVHDGDYGICLDCELPISPKRLEAIPEAVRCVTCEGALERSAERDGGRPADDEDAC